MPLTEAAQAGHEFVFTNLKTGSGVDTVIQFITDKGGLDA